MGSIMGTAPGGRLARPLATAAVNRLGVLQHQSRRPPPSAASSGRKGGKTNGTEQPSDRTQGCFRRRQGAREPKEHQGGEKSRCERARPDPVEGQGQEVARAGRSSFSLLPACQALDPSEQESSIKPPVGELLAP